MKPIAGFALWMLSVSLVSAEGPAQQPAETVARQEFNFPPDGIIRWKNSYGDLYIEGWDNPKVEIVVTKTTRFYEPQLAPKQAGKLETVNIDVKRPSDKEMEIAVALPPRHDWAPPLPKTSRNGIRLVYQIQVPRTTRLIIDHHGGQVTIGNVTADVHADNRDGDILLLLPASGSYSIDARTKMGHIASDFAGHTISRFLVGQGFTASKPSPARRLHLQTGFGGITILALPPEGEALARGGKE
jgi:hypothetical protein